jgi:PAS domain S-box-containing protein
MTAPPTEPTTLAERTRAFGERLGLTPARYFTPEIRSPWIRIAIALAVTAVALAVYARNRELFGEQRIFLFGFLAVVVAAWLGRLIGGLVATLGWAFGALWLFVDPPGSFAIENADDARALTVFAVIGLIVGLLVEGLHAARRGGVRAALERQRLAEELVVEQNRLELLLANLPGLVWELRVEPPLWPPKVQFASANALRLTGYPPEQWRRRDLLWEELVPESERESFEEALREAVRRGSSNFRHVWRHADGLPRTFDTHFTARPSRSGTHHDVRCVSLDVTALESAERALAETERRFRAAADRAPILIRISQPDRGTVWLNRAWLDFRGRPSEEERGSGWHEGVHPDDLDRVLAMLSASFEAREEYRTEYRLRRADGTWRWVLSVGVPRVDARGEYQDHLGFCFDIDDRKQLEIEREELLRATEMAREAAEIATRSKDEFLAKVSHELRNPLNGILGWSQILAAPETSEEELRRGVALIDTSARTLARLVDDLLDVSRILSGKLALELAPVRLEPVIGAACDEIRPAAEARGVTVDCRVAEPLPAVLGDTPRLHQVLWNLLSNAVKFTPRGGRVELVAAQRDSVVEIAVADDGEGIDPAFLPHLFEPFRQQDAGAARRHQGLGLGLSIVSQLVDRHGGSVAAESPGRGHGSRFTVRLPVAAVAADLAAAPASSPATLDRLRVVVVDDDPIAREMLRTVLARAGALVEDAASVPEAFAAVATAPPDVVVSDLEMPGEDGFSLIRRLRALPLDAGGATPALALTAYAQDIDRHAALDAGFQEHLAKPVDARALVETVGRLARR